MGRDQAETLITRKTPDVVGINVTAGDRKLNEFEIKIINFIASWLKRLRAQMLHGPLCDL